MTWFVASLRDGDTHLGENSTGATVTARCGRSFRPLASLAESPPDPLQICPDLRPVTARYLSCP